MNVASTASSGLLQLAHSGRRVARRWYGMPVRSVTGDRSAGTGSGLVTSASSLTRRPRRAGGDDVPARGPVRHGPERSEEHTSELQSRFDLVCRLLLGKKKD